MAGYASEEEEEVEKEGSSVEEEQHATEDDDVHPPGVYGKFHKAKEDLELLLYCRHPHGNLELAQPGCLVHFSPLHFQEVNALTHISQQSDGKKSHGTEGICI